MGTANRLTVARATALGEFQLGLRLLVQNRTNYLAHNGRRLGLARTCRDYICVSTLPESHVLNT